MCPQLEWEQIELRIDLVPDLSSIYGDSVQQKFHVITNARHAKGQSCPSLLSGHAERSGDDNGSSEKGDQQIDGEKGNRRQLD